MRLNVLLYTPQVLPLTLSPFYSAPILRTSYSHYLFHQGRVHVQYVSLRKKLVRSLGCFENKQQSIRPTSKATHSLPGYSYDLWFLPSSEKKEGSACLCAPITCYFLAVAAGHTGMRGTDQRNLPDSFLNPFHFISIENSKVWLNGHDGTYQTRL